jgi:hypothetical protein
MNSRKSTALVLAALTSVAMSLQAPMAGTIAGRIEDQGGDPFRGWPVVARSASAVPAVARYTRTRPDGTYRFDGLPEGSFTVSIPALMGFEGIRRQGVHVTKTSAAREDFTAVLGVRCECVNQGAQGQNKRR